MTLKSKLKGLGRVDKLQSLAIIAIGAGSIGALSGILPAIVSTVMIVGGILGAGASVIGKKKLF